MVGLAKVVASSLFIAAFALGPAGCSGDDDDPGADAALGADASEDLPDAALTTSCGPEDQEINCDWGTQICVMLDVGGGGPTYSCESKPTHCLEVRNCAVCSSVCEPPADECDDVEAENTILCYCPDC